jgi:hypothetical protein
LSLNITGNDRQRNFRDPALTLDSLYGAGPIAAPFIYERDKEKIVIGTTQQGRPEDLVRASNKMAIIGDPRNDENLIIGQMHLAFSKAHNRLFDALFPV